MNGVEVTLAAGNALYSGTVTSCAADIQHMSDVEEMLAGYALYSGTVTSRAADTQDINDVEVTLSVGCVLYNETTLLVIRQHYYLQI